MQYSFTLTAPSQTPTTLYIDPKNEPAGWEDATFTLRRSRDYHGVFGDFSVELRFFCQAYDFIRHVWLNEGIDGEIIVRVYHHCNADGTATLVYEGRLNLSTLVFDEDQGTVTANLESQTRDQVFLNRLQTPIDLFARRSLDSSFDNLLDYETAQLPTPLLSTIPGKVLFAQTILEGGGGGCGGDGLIGGFQIGGNDLAAHLVFQHAFQNRLLADVPFVHTAFAKFVALAFTNRVGYPPLPAQLNPTPNPPNDLVYVQDLVQPVFTPAIDGIPDNDSCYQICYRIKARVRVFICRGNLSGGPVPVGNARLWWANRADYGSGMVEINSGFAFNIAPIPDQCNFLVNPCTTQNTAWHWDFEIDTGLIEAGTLCLSVQDAVKLWLQIAVEFDGSATNVKWTADVTYLEGTRFYVKQALKAPDSTARTFPVYEAFAKTLDAITNRQLLFYSEYFGRTNAYPVQYPENGCGSFEVLTTGQLLRGFQYVNAPNPGPGECVSGTGISKLVSFFVSFKQLFDNLNAVHNLGMGLVDLPFPYPPGTRAVRIERKAAFYQDHVIFSIPNLDKREAKFKREVARDYIYTQVKIGYETWENEGINGLDEFNSIRTYTNKTQTYENSLNLVSQFISSGLAVELTRLQGVSNNDWKFDDAIFHLATPQNPALIHLIEQGSAVTTQNLLAPQTAINMRLSPWYNLRRWYDWLAYYSALTTAVWTFSEGQGNYAAVFQAQDGSGGSGAGCSFYPYHQEDDPITEFNAFTTGSGLPFFFPEVVKFDYPITFSEYNAIKQNPYGRVRVSDGHSPYESFFLLELHFKPNGLSRWKLLKAV